MTILDTNICVRFLRGEESVVRRLLDADENDDLRIPAMVEGELFYGVEKSDLDAFDITQGGSFYFRTEEE